jgi:hypothetical protein
MGIGSILLLAGMGPAGSAIPETCQVAIQVKSCGGEVKPQVLVEVLLKEGDQEERTLRATTDDDGRARFDVCADRVDEVRVFLFEDAPPMTSEPLFESDPESPGMATTLVVLC